MSRSRETDSILSESVEQIIAFLFALVAAASAQYYAGYSTLGGYGYAAPLSYGGYYGGAYAAPAYYGGYGYGYYKK